MSGQPPLCRELRPVLPDKGPSRRWNNFVRSLGDGAVITKGASKETHTYAINGTYIVTLTVADNFGNANSQSQTIIVLPAPIVSFEIFSHNLFVSGNRLVQNVTVQVTNPNSYPKLVNVRIAGNCDTVCPFSDQSIMAKPCLLAFICRAASSAVVSLEIQRNSFSTMSFATKTIART